MEIESSKIEVYQITFKKPFCTSGAGQDFVIPIKISNDLLGCSVIFPGGYSGRVASILDDKTIIRAAYDITLSVGENQSIAILPNTQKPETAILHIPKLY